MKRPSAVQRRAHPCHGWLRCSRTHTCAPAHPSLFPSQSRRFSRLLGSTCLCRLCATSTTLTSSPAPTASPQALANGQGQPQHILLSSSTSSPSGGGSLSSTHLSPPPRPVETRRQRAQRPPQKPPARVTPYEGQPDKASQRRRLRAPAERRQRQPRQSIRRQTEVKAQQRNCR